ncbi:hypothetical protein BZL30_8492 [Mycobacterium kansasii]|uniref:Uncharacterized protein n=1 Tax=Mycobacterium kansasii TaxID=1768 RepID=A0A1V3WIL0_MYCKA|nr:hypothetical protein BZL30_8492 [Mycobacterium kansasii]
MIARQMDTIRDQFIVEVFDTMKSEIQGLDYDSRMMDMWQASITENYVAAVHYLERDAPTSLLEAPPAALAYARQRLSAMCAGAVGSSASARPCTLSRGRDAVCVVLEPAQRVPTITELVNRSSRSLTWWRPEIVATKRNRTVLSATVAAQQSSASCWRYPVRAARREVLRYRLDGMPSPRWYG